MLEMNGGPRCDAPAIAVSDIDNEGSEEEENHAYRSSP
jgi:hypothetical protein